MEKLINFMFPVAERKVFFGDENGNPLFTDAYQAITREDNGKLISVMSDSYWIVPNAEIIKPLMEQLQNLDSRWIIDPSHSFVSDARMRLQVTFPDLTFNDGRSDIALSLFLHNSYDGSEGVRLFWGAIRGICSNGMVFGKVLAKFYARHTSGIRLDNLKEQVEQTYDQIPVIKKRISMLQNIGVTKSLEESVEKQLGKTIAKYVNDQPCPANQWILYNYFTWYISHVIDQRMRAAYQMKVSKLFQL
ncbi:MAG: DUF945 domain-containing protein [Ignavibacteriaceae bacterium]|jgi:hypothetical protein|nr:DUF945 domain-containing protein [Ignavibacteriaceae bacterium]